MTLGSDPNISIATQLAVLIQKVDHAEEDRKRDMGIVHSRIDEVQEDLAEIKAQTKETNGRVTALEKWRVGVDAVKAAFSWKAPLLVGIAVAASSAVIAAIVTAIFTT